MSERERDLNGESVSERGGTVKLNFYPSLSLSLSSFSFSLSLSPLPTQIQDEDGVIRGKSVTAGRIGLMKCCVARQGIVCLGHFAWKLTFSLSLSLSLSLFNIQDIVECPNYVDSASHRQLHWEETVGGKEPGTQVHCR